MYVTSYDARTQTHALTLSWGCRCKPSPAVPLQLPWVTHALPGPPDTHMWPQEVSPPPSLGLHFLAGPSACQPWGLPHLPKLTSSPPAQAHTVAFPTQPLVLHQVSVTRGQRLKYLAKTGESAETVGDLHVLCNVNWLFPCPAPCLWNYWYKSYLV